MLYSEILHKFSTYTHTDVPELFPLLLETSVLLETPLIRTHTSRKRIMWVTLKVPTYLVSTDEQFQVVARASESIKEKLRHVPRLTPCSTLNGVTCHDSVPNAPRIHDTRPQKCAAETITGQNVLKSIVSPTMDFEDYLPPWNFSWLFPGCSPVLKLMPRNCSPT